MKSMIEKQAISR